MNGPIRNYFKSYLGTGADLILGKKNEVQLLQELINSHTRQREIIGDETTRKMKERKLAARRPLGGLMLAASSMIGVMLAICLRPDHFWFILLTGVSYMAVALYLILEEAYG